jgi:hypothetical protein
MQRWKRKMLNTGVSLSIVGGGALIAAGAAAAHDATDSSTPEGPAHHGPFHHAVQGVVATVGTDSFAITTHKGTTKTINTTATTTFAESGTPVAPTGVSVGETVTVSLDPTNATPTAVRVTVLLSRASGKVTAVGGTSITLEGPRDSGRDVVISSGTLYFNGAAAATGVTVGEFVTAFGTRDTSTPTDLDAMFVDIFPTAVHPGGAPGVTPPLPTPGAPRHDDNDAREHAPTTTTTVTGSTVTTPPPASGRGGPGPSGDDNQNGVGDNDHDNDGPGDIDAPGDNDGHGDNGGGSSGGGNGSGGHGGRG